MVDDREYGTGAEDAAAVRDDSRDRKSLVPLLVIIAVIVIVALMLLLLRSCGASRAASQRDTGVKEIVPVSGLAPADGTVSVWLSRGTDISTVLSKAGLADAQATDMGGGRYVVEVPVGAEDSAVSALKSASGVHDAGRVYEASGTSGSPSP